MGELEKWVEDALCETCCNDYGYIDPCLENIKMVFEEVRNEFPFIMPEGCNSLNQAILYWESYIEILKMSRADKDKVQIPWIETSVKRLKWLKRWFDTN